MGAVLNSRFIIRGDDLSDDDEVDVVYQSLIQDLERLLADPASRHILLDMCRSISGIDPPHGRWAAGELQAHVRPLLEGAFQRGDLVIVIDRFDWAAISADNESAQARALAEKKEREAAESAQRSAQRSAQQSKAAPRESTRKHWVEFKVIDDETGKPVEGVDLIVRLPDGSSQNSTTNAAGVVRFNGLDDGTCDVKCDHKGLLWPSTLEFVSME